jgi:hypothetical protein
MTAAERDRQITLDDDQLGRQCEISFVRSGGPGGQHRNKVSSGVRLLHLPTGATAMALERRSQHENRRHALTRLRRALALDVRCPAGEPLPSDLAAILTTRWPNVSTGNLDYWRLAACLLDRLQADGVRLSDTAARLGVSTASLARFLSADDHLWRKVCLMREAAGLSPLRRN